MKNFTSAMTHRTFVRTSAAVAGGLVLESPLSRAAQPGAPSRKIPIGLELYSLRDQCKTDLFGMLVAVSKIGYKGVEFAGYHGKSAAEIRKVLDDNGLVTCGTHTQYVDLQGDKLKATIDLNRALGNKFVIIPYMTGRDKKEWLDKAKEVNELADRLKPEGMFIGYHAHAHDFKAVDGETPWNIFASNTKPEVILQLDTSNCVDGGGDPVAELKKFPGRARSIHVKPNGSGPEAVIGEDKIQWSEIFAFCEGPGKTDWYVIEHETSKDPLATVKRTFEAMQKLGRA